VAVMVRTTDGERAIEATDILVATGRTPNTTGIGLDVAGVELDSRGYIAVNDRLETSAAGVWAIGECAGSPQFTHVSVDDFRVIRDNLAGGHRTTRGRVIPFCLFTAPPRARRWPRGSAGSAPRCEDVLFSPEASCTRVRRGRFRFLPSVRCIQRHAPARARPHL